VPRCAARSRPARRTGDAARRCRRWYWWLGGQGRGQRADHRPAVAMPAR
jgi:hypothetical protein